MRVFLGVVWEGDQLFALLMTDFERPPMTDPTADPQRVLFATGEC